MRLARTRRYSGKQRLECRRPISMFSSRPSTTHAQFQCSPQGLVHTPNFNVLLRAEYCTRPISMFSSAASRYVLQCCCLLLPDLSELCRARMAAKEERMVGRHRRQPRLGRRRAFKVLHHMRLLLPHFVDLLQLLAASEHQQVHYAHFVDACADTHIITPRMQGLAGVVCH
jgi:hypothetical protein